MNDYELELTLEVIYIMQRLRKALEKDNSDEVKVIYDELRQAVPQIGEIIHERYGEEL